MGTSPNKGILGQNNSGQPSLSQIQQNLTLEQQQKEKELEALRIRMMRRRGRGLLTQSTPNSTLG